MKKYFLSYHIKPHNVVAAAVVARPPSISDQAFGHSATSLGRSRRSLHGIK